MGLLDTYRKNVFYDYSVVTKAMFYGLEKTPAKTYKVIEKLPVQINPNNLTEIAPSTIGKGEGILAGINNLADKEAELPPKKRPESKRLSIRLDYDIYDEYNIRTCDGMSGALGAFEEISLSNENLTSLPKLIEYGNSNGVYVLFRWGSIKFFGIIRDVSCTYTAFSPWGDPLKCEAVVDMSEIKLDPKTLKGIVAQCFGKTEMLETVTTTIAPIVSEVSSNTALLSSVVYPFSHANR